MHTAKFLFCFALVLSGCAMITRGHTARTVLDSCTQTENRLGSTVLAVPPTNAEVMRRLAAAAENQLYHSDEDSEFWIAANDGKIIYCRFSGDYAWVRTYWVFDDGETPTLIESQSWVTVG